MTLRVQTAGPVQVVTLDRPDIRNALDQATIAAVADQFEQVAAREPLPADPERARLSDGSLDIGPNGTYRPHVVVLRSSGDVFCAGAHLGEMKALGEADFQTNLDAALQMGAMFRAIRNCPAPVVARVQGAAYGGGVGLLAACDLVVADSAAPMSFTEVKLGLVPGVIAPLVIGRIGPGPARRYFLTAEAFDGARAAAIGLADLAVESDRLDQTVESMVDLLLAGGPAALGRCKSLLEGTETLGFARSAEFSARLIAEARTGPEAQAALKAFASRQPAPWHPDAPWTLPPVPDEVSS